MSASQTTTVDLDKVSYADFFFETADGQCKAKRRPEGMTVHGRRINPDEPALPLSDHPGETVGQRAVRRGLVDRWVPVIVLRVSSADKLRFSGERAEKLWDAWNARLFGRQARRGSSA
jgi:hypothetical protein